MKDKHVTFKAMFCEPINMTISHKHILSFIYTHSKGEGGVDNLCVIWPVL